MKSLTIRNLVGAFLGGFLGILTCYYLSLALMPFGCLFGVVVGFWHDKLTVDWRGQLNQLRARLSSWRASLQTWRRRSRKRKSALTQFESELLGGFQTLLRWARILIGWIVRSFLWILTSPVPFTRWLARHPMNRAYAITCVVSITGAAIMVCSGYLSYGVGLMESNNKGGSILLAFVAIGILLTAATSVFLPMMTIGTTSDDRGTFYREYDRYMRYGALKYALYQVKNLLVFGLYFFVAGQAVLYGLLVVAGLLLLAVLFGLFIVAPLRTFWKCVTLPGHWFCFGSTVLTTLVTWLCVRSHVTNPALAWTAALSNGILAAAVTEGSRRGYMFLVERFAALYEIVHTPDVFELDKFVWERIGSPFCGLCRKLFRPIGKQLSKMLPDSEGFWSFGM